MNTNIILPTNHMHIQLELSLVDSETVDAFKHGLKDLNSPP